MKITEKNKRILLNHYDVLSAFKEDYYKDLITKDHLGDEAVIKVDDDQVFVFPVRYKGKVYAINSDTVEKGKLPIKINKAVKVAYKAKVFHYVKKFASAKIMEERVYNFRKLMDTMADFMHSEPDEFLLYKISCFMLYLRKGFARFVSDAAFGKNSFPTILKTLMTDISIINPRSAAALEHKLIHNQIVLDELTNLTKEQRDLMQEALLRIADGATTYEKGTRGSAKLGTKDEYDISQLSVLILYNVYEYYQQSGQGEKYFDNVFQYAVKSRFLPLKMKGNLDATQFVHIAKPKEVAKVLKEDIKKIIRTIKYFQNNLEKEIDKKNFKLYKEYRIQKEGRHDKTFYMICDGIKLYAKDEVEYNKLVGKLYRMVNRYSDMMEENKVQEIPFEEDNATGTGSEQKTLM